MDRIKLDTVIEKEVHTLVRNIREHMYDFTHLYIRRNNIPLDHAQVEEVLKIAKLAVDDGEMSKIGMFHEKLKVSLDKFAGEENPTPHSEPELELVPTPMVATPAKKVSFHF